MDTFSALADPNRRNIIELLAANGRLPAGAIYDRFSVSPQAISQHLKVLKKAELVVVKKQAQQRIYSVNPEKVEEIEVWVAKLARMLDAKYDRLEKVLNEERKKLLKGSKMK